MRMVAIIFGILAAIVDLILVIVSIAVPEVSLWGWIVVLTIVMHLICWLLTKFL